MMGINIKSPDFLKSNRDDYDIVVIASTRYYSEIRDNLFAMGFAKEEIRWWM